MGNQTLTKAETELAYQDDAVPSITSERDLVQAARRDPAAFTRLYRRYVDPVYRYLYKWTGNSAEAEDLTSQVFIEVLEKLVHYQE
jgi:RNA polymerase sigma-70 factor (ECF subfamily)